MRHETVQRFLENQQCLLQDDRSLLKSEEERLLQRVINS